MHIIKTVAMSFGDGTHHDNPDIAIRLLRSALEQG